LKHAAPTGSEKKQAEQCQQKAGLKTADPGIRRAGVKKIGHHVRPGSGRRGVPGYLEKSPPMISINAASANDNMYKGIVTMYLSAF